MESIEREKTENTSKEEPKLAIPVYIPGESRQVMYIPKNLQHLASALFPQTNQ